VSFIRHKKIYRHDVQGEAEHRSNFPSDHRCDESSAGYSFVGCSPAAPTSALPATTSFSPYSVAVQFSAANQNCPPNRLSQPRGPLQPIHQEFTSFSRWTSRKGKSRTGFLDAFRATRTIRLCAKRKSTCGRSGSIAERICCVTWLATAANSNSELG
jgi:hypothetical protein